MRKLSVRLFSVLSFVSIVAGTLSVSQSASASVSIQPVPPAGTFTASCTTGNFKGEAQFTPKFNGGSSWTGSGNTWTATVDHYRIQRFNGQQGGNKANVKMRIAQNRTNAASKIYAPAMGWKSSPDSMMQDGQWHFLDMSLSQEVSLNVTNELVVDIAFVFDKSGGDPSCSTSKTVRVEKEMYGIRKDPLVVDFQRPLGSCLTLTPNQSCEIDKTVTTSSTVTVGGGVDLKWVKAELNKSWSDSLSVMIGCNSPIMEPGQVYWAWPTGTAYRFTAANNFFENKLDEQAGTAFEVDGGVACGVGDKSGIPTGKVNVIPAQ